MNISLTPELEHYILKKVNSGLYTSASEVIRESLRCLRNKEVLQTFQVDQLNQDIDIGLKQLESGKKVSAASSYSRLKNKLKGEANNNSE